MIFLCKSEQLKLLLATLDEPIGTPPQEQDYGGKGGRQGVTSSHDAMMSANAQRLCASEEAWDTEKKDLCKMATVPLNSCAHARPICHMPFSFLFQMNVCQHKVLCISVDVAA